MTKDVTNALQNQPLDAHRFPITIFPDNLARTKNEREFTLPSLVDFIRATKAARKDQLPLCKLALFGNVVSTKGCLRTDANMREITGIEVEHDAGTVSFKQAVKILREGGLRCLIYTTPSHKPIERERWRILLPVSRALPVAERRRLVELVNGLFDGQLARESFVNSQAFYFGEVEGSYLQVTMLDGVFVDLAGLTKAIGPASLPGKGKGAAATIGQGHTLEELDAMLAACPLSDGDGWWDTMRTLTSSYVARGWNEADIIAKLAPKCRLGADDPQLLDFIASARQKFGRKQMPKGLVALLRPVDNVDSLPDRVEEPERPADDAPLADKVKWLIETHGYEKVEDRVVILHQEDNACRIKLNAFYTEYGGWFEMRFGPMGGRPEKVKATGGWFNSPHKLSIAGVRMAPDRPFPVYQEGKAWFKNTYQRPRHAVADGDVEPFLRFLERLIPDQTEREYKLDWMAHKLRHPEVPGCAIMHVADNDRGEGGAHEGSFGTGRGILFSIARMLFGDQYCSEQDFSILDGSSGQAAYNAWMHNNLLVTCDESPSSPTWYRSGERHQAYNTIKRIIDPAETKRTFIGKYKEAFSGRCHCSIWIATNHIDALAIPAKDRRITVLRNGRKPTRAEITEIVAWRGAPGSLAALEGFLRDRDISEFNIYEPLETAGKADMVEASLSDVDQVMLEMMEDETKGLVFLRDDLFNAVRVQYNQNEGIGGHFKAAWRKYVVKAVRPDGGQRRHRSGGTQKKMFCFWRNARQVEILGEEEASRELGKWRPGLGSHLKLVVSPESEAEQ